MSIKNQTPSGGLKKKRRSNRLIHVVALLLFLLIGAVFTSPALIGPQGTVRGACTGVLLLVTFAILAWREYKGKFRFVDWFVYLAIVLLFSAWAESL